MTTSPFSAQTIEQVLELTDAYIQEFKPPLNRAFLTQIVESAIPQIKGIEINEKSLKQQLIAEVIERFDPLAALNHQVDADAIKLAKTVHQNLKNFTPEKGVAEALNVLDAYIQQYKPSLIPASLYPVVKTILPQLKGLKLDQASIERLANQAILKFSPELVPTKILSPRARAIATLVAQQIQNFQPEQAVLGVLGVLDAYIQQSRMSPTEATLYQIARQVIPQMLKMAMSDDQKDQFATQVMFQFKKRPEPIKSPSQAARDIAAKLVSEVEQMRSIRAKELGVVDTTKAIATGDLEVRSAFVIQP